jgi:hypothetical protein
MRGGPAGGLLAAYPRSGGGFEVDGVAEGFELADQSAGACWGSLREAIQSAPRSWWTSNNLVERWFGELTTKKLRRSSHATVKTLADDLNAWTQAWNDKPHPYRWVNTADQILESIASYCQLTSNSGH